ncbi:hypothetical protein M0R45_016223 [Rubus argutus]|uniref:Uncharacterized protein n=1 Tax=Rubus argutus TaxID=59490 RepID=A0AAW1XSS1_RUBAR
MGVSDLDTQRERQRWVDTGERTEADEKPGGEVRSGLCGGAAEDGWVPRLGPERERSREGGRQLEATPSGCVGGAEKVATTWAESNMAAATLGATGTGDTARFDGTVLVVRGRGRSCALVMAPRTGGGGSGHGVN